MKQVRELRKMVKDELAESQMRTKNFSKQNRKKENENCSMQEPKRYKL